MGEGIDFSPSEDSEGESEATDMDDFCILDAPGTGIPVSLLLSLCPPFLNSSIFKPGGYFQVEHPCLLD